MHAPMGFAALHPSAGYAGYASYAGSFCLAVHSNLLPQSRLF